VKSSSDVATSLILNHDNIIDRINLIYNSGSIKKLLQHQYQCKRNHSDDNWEQRSHKENGIHTNSLNNIISTGMSCDQWLKWTSFPIYGSKHSPTLDRYNARERNTITNKAPDLNVPSPASKNALQPLHLTTGGTVAYQFILIGKITNRRHREQQVLNTPKP